MKITITTTVELDVPAGTKVIRNDEWLTLARKKGGEIFLLTCPIEDINAISYHEDDSWVRFSKWELEDIIGKK